MTTPTTTPHEFILASASPRRAELLRQHGYRFRVVVPPVAEPAAEQSARTAAGQAETISLFKARSVAALVRSGTILAADTIVVTGDAIIGKPTDADHARAILAKLAGTTHTIITGVALLDAPTSHREVTYERTAVTMRPLSTEELDTYLASGAWRGKAGAYGIQDRGDRFIERIDGSFTNVVGLPMEKVTEMLARSGIRPATGRDA